MLLGVKIKLLDNSWLLLFDLVLDTVSLSVSKKGYKKGPAKF